MGEIKRAARRNPSGFLIASKQQAKEQANLLTKFCFCLLFIEMRFNILQYRKDREALKNKEKPAIRWDRGLPCFGDPAGIRTPQQNRKNTDLSMAFLQSQAREQAFS